MRDYQQSGLTPRAHARARPALVMAAMWLAAVLVACMGQPAAAPIGGGAALATAPPAAGQAVSPIPASSEPPLAAAPAPTDRPRPTPGPTVPSVPALVPPAYASRVVVPDLGIDLPVISGDLQPPPSYPLCDVAAYVTRFNQPYEPGITYLSAHAQRGMFLPLLEASLRADGQELLGQRIDVYTSDGRRFGYRIESVVRHAVDYAVVTGLAAEQRYLILQTSEGPYGTLEKLQVVAIYEEETTVDPVEAAPEPRPRDCRPPELGG